MRSYEPVSLDATASGVGKGRESKGGVEAVNRFRVSMTNILVFIDSETRTTTQRNHTMLTLVGSGKRPVADTHSVSYPVRT